MLNDNITGTLGNHICAYWRAAFSYAVAYDMWRQYSSEKVGEDITMVVSVDDLAGESSREDDYVGESLPKDVDIVFIAPYLFSYCTEHAENGDYKVIIGKW